jgi:cob(I)alamin adenosyltransferase
MLKTGLIQVYTGNCAGTNFVPLGLGLRAVGRNLRVHISCFTPSELMDGALLISDLLKPNLFIHQPQGEQNVTGSDWNPTEIDDIKRSFKISKEALEGGQFDVVVLNGINRIVNQGIIPSNALLDLIQRKPKHVELVLSGPDADKEVLERADLITEMVTHGEKEEALGDSDDPDCAPTEVVTGNGKGKTTYCLGKAMLMSGIGIRAKILQFIKSPKAYGEVRAIEKLPGLDIETLGEGFLRTSGEVPDRKHLDAARSAWEACLREIFSLEYGLVVLDEINIATRYALIRPERVRELLFLKPRNLHLILSGRNAHKDVMDGASSVIEMKEIKHPLKKGIKARKGIEF